MNLFRHTKAGRPTIRLPKTSLFSFPLTDLTLDHDDTLKRTRQPLSKPTNVNVGKKKNKINEKLIYCYGKREAMERERDTPNLRRKFTASKSYNNLPKLVLKQSFKTLFPKPFLLRMDVKSLQIIFHFF